MNSSSSSHTSFQTTCLFMQQISSDVNENAVRTMRPLGNVQDIIITISLILPRGKKLLQLWKVNWTNNINNKLDSVYHLSFHFFKTNENRTPFMLVGTQLYCYSYILVIFMWCIFTNMHYPCAKATILPYLSSILHYW